MIRVDGLSKRFGAFSAVEPMSFEVEQGEIFGFLGPNGAGKTTTIRILATLIPPTTGSARIAGFDVVEDPERVREVMGYMPDQWGVYPDITVREYLEFFAAAYGVGRRERARTVGDVMELTDLTGLADRLVEELSKGMRQRLCLGKTLVHDPQLLILDEPANGLDPRARIELRELLRELASMGKTILISSHILTELSDLVTSVGIVERGRMIMSGSLSSILARLDGGDEEVAPHIGDGLGDVLRGADAVVGDGSPVTASDGDPGEARPASGPGRSPTTGSLRRYKLCVPAAQVASAKERLLSLPDLREVGQPGERELAFALRGDEEAVGAVVRALVQVDIDVLGLSPVKSDLEAVFMAVTRGQVQ